MDLYLFLRSSLTYDVLSVIVDILIRMENAAALPKLAQTLSNMFYWYSPHFNQLTSSCEEIREQMLNRYIVPMNHLFTSSLVHKRDQLRLIICPFVSFPLLDIGNILIDQVAFMKSGYFYLVVFPNSTAADSYRSQNYTYEQILVFCNYVRNNLYGDFATKDLILENI